MWNKLSVLHEQRSESNKLFLMTKFHEYRMLSSDLVAQHITKVENMARRQRDVGEQVSNVTVIAKVLGSLPPKYGAFVTAWDNLDPANQTLDSLMLRLIREGIPSAFAAVNFGHAQSGSLQPNGPQVTGSQYTQKKKTVECHFCHKKGHIMKN